MSFLYETHLHTFESSHCAWIKAAEQVKLYKDLGYAGIIVTDHLKSLNFKIGQLKHLKLLMSWEKKVEYLTRGYKKAKEEGDKIGLDVFLGWEFTYQGSDFLTYGLGVNFLLKNNDLDAMPIEAYSALIRNNGGYIAQAHPYRNKAGERRVPVDPRLLDGVEVFNAARHGKEDENQKALDFARSHDLPTQAGTDSHRRLDPKSYSGIITGKKMENINDIINAIKTRTATPILPPMDYKKHNASL